jgi:5-methylcytosine-specific restriction endonuclease McrA
VKRGQADRRSAEAERYRKLYKSKAWQELRIRVFVRDCGICGICRRAIIGRFDADHRRAHKGNLLLFWDETNIQVLHPDCHAKAKQRDEARGYEAGCDASGQPVDPAHHWAR